MPRAISVTSSTHRFIVVLPSDVRLGQELEDRLCAIGPGSILEITRGLIGVI